eukprot:snap_masked-scaffold4919_size5242-processed-gene-0.2 protein:Tk06625 transcript:snap_masked-scaffold4919_size5242-processed-gene-0.2-mRNA-1 annotation:"hypothetical protein"
MEQQEVTKVVAKARAFFRAGKTRDLAGRRARLGRLEEVLVARREELLAALAEDLGKPGLEAFVSEYYFLLQELRLVRKKMKGWLKRKRVGSPPYFWPCRSWVEREPFGVVLVMAPWNYPFQLSFSPLIAAIAAGNTVVLKPSELAPASERVIAEIVQEAFSEGEVEVVTGGVEVAKSLLEEKFDFIFFTGSTAVGREVALKAAETLTPTLMELGGKCPCVVDAGVDLEKTARRVLAGKFFNGGQTCFAPDFVAVAAEVRAEFVEICMGILKEVPWDHEMARMISAKHAERVRSLCDGSELVFGQDDPERDFLAPRLLPQASWDDAAMQEEVFGPVLPVVSYETRAELLARLGKWESPLAIYLFTQDGDFVDAVKGALASGSLCVNDTMKQFSQLGMPLGGVGASGHGRYRGRYGVEALSYERAVMKRYFWGKDLGELMPPYEKAYGWVRRFLR